MFTFFLVLHAIIAAALVLVILMQRSEGGGFTGGSPSGLMSARGAADFLTRTTTVLATLFILLSIGLAALATVNRGSTALDTSLAAKPGAAPVIPDATQNSAVPMAGAGAPATPLAATEATTPVAAAKTDTASQQSKPAVRREVKPVPEAKPLVRTKPAVASKPTVSAPKPEAAAPVVTPPAAPAPVGNTP